MSPVGIQRRIASATGSVSMRPAADVSIIVRSAGTPMRRTIEAASASVLWHRHHDVIRLSPFMRVKAVVRRTSSKDWRELDLAAHYAIAKVKGAVIAVTGP